MSAKGWNSLKPITTPDQMSAPIHWNPMNEDWKMRLTKSQIYNTSSGFDTQTLDAMKKLHVLFTISLKSGLLVIQEARSLY